MSGCPTRAAPAGWWAPRWTTPASKPCCRVFPPTRWPTAPWRRPRCRMRCRWGCTACLWRRGCANVPGVVTDTAGGSTVEHALAGQGAPVVVFENGLGANLDWWAKVWPDTVQETTALAYNRAGYGHSEASPGPRDGAHVVEELRALLKARKLPPPYVLVGHSLGGLYMQLFARQYPGEVAALVLVDSTHPDQMRGAGNPDLWPTWLKVAFR